MQNAELFDLTGKVAIITGASKGIGASIAAAYAQAGAHVVISSRKQDALDQLADELGQTGGTVTGIAANAGDAVDLQHLVQQTMAVYGGIDILVCNAAANPVFGPVENTDAGAFDKIMQVNVHGPFQLAQLALPHLRARGGGSIINISSIGGLRPEPGLGIYSVSKAALLSLTQVMAKEWGKDNIRANAICPGLIKTKFSEALWSDEKLLERMTRHLPLGRIGTPEEIAALALFLASPAAAYCTGGVYTADGGHTI